MIFFFFFEVSNRDTQNCWGAATLHSAPALKIQEINKRESAAGEAAIDPGDWQICLSFFLSVCLLDLEYYGMDHLRRTRYILWPHNLLRVCLFPDVLSRRWKKTHRKINIKYIWYKMLHKDVKLHWLKPQTEVHGLRSLSISTLLFLSPRGMRVNTPQQPRKYFGLRWYFLLDFRF